MAPLFVVILTVAAVLGRRLYSVSRLVICCGTMMMEDDRSNSSVSLLLVETAVVVLMEVVDTEADTVDSAALMVTIMRHENDSTTAAKTDWAELMK